MATVMPTVTRWYPRAVSNRRCVARGRKGGMEGGVEEGREGGEEGREGGREET